MFPLFQETGHLILICAIDKHSKRFYSHKTKWPTSWNCEKALLSWWHNRSYSKCNWQHNKHQEWIKLEDSRHLLASTGLPLVAKGGLYSAYVCSITIFGNENWKTRERQDHTRPDWGGMTRPDQIRLLRNLTLLQTKIEEHEGVFKG